MKAYRDRIFSLAQTDLRTNSYIKSDLIANKNPRDIKADAIRRWLGDTYLLYPYLNSEPLDEDSFGINLLNTTQFTPVHHCIGFTLKDLHAGIELAAHISPSDDDLNIRQLDQKVGTIMTSLYTAFFPHPVQQIKLVSNHLLESNEHNVFKAWMERVFFEATIEEIRATNL